MASTVTVDLSAQKWLWKRRVRTVVLVRDILDDDVGFHPIGGSPGRSLLVALKGPTALCLQVA